MKLPHMNNELRATTVIRPQSGGQLAAAVTKLTLSVFALAIIIGASQIAAFGQSVYPQYSPVGGNVGRATIDFTMPDGVTGTITRTNFACALTLAAEPNLTTLRVFNRFHDAAVNYPNNYFFIRPSNPAPFVYVITFRDKDNTACNASSLVGRITVTYDSPVRDILYNFHNNDGATVTFTTTAGAALNPQRLSGNNEFEITGNVLNSTTTTVLNDGCESNTGGNPNGACGTIAFPGVQTSFRMDLREVTTQDGWQFNQSMQHDYGDAPASYDGTDPGRHQTTRDADTAVTLKMGATVDYDSTAKSSANATGDDVSGNFAAAGATTDEDGVERFAAVPPGSTTYTVNVSVFNALTVNATLYGWIDFDSDGTFDSNERASITVAPGTSRLPITFNVPAGSLVGAATAFARFRLTTDTLPVGTGTAVDPASRDEASNGEIEDYQFAVLTTAALNSVAGNVKGLGTRGIRQATVNLIDSTGAAHTTRTDLKGNFNFADIPVGTAIITVTAKGYQFTPSYIVRDIVEDISELEFTATPAGSKRQRLLSSID